MTLVRPRVAVFYRHSIRTRIKTRRCFSNHPFWLNSIVIPLEQGLRHAFVSWDSQHQHHSIVIPLEQGLRRLGVRLVPDVLKILSSFH